MYHTKVHSIVSVLWFCFETSEMFSKAFAVLKLITDGSNIST